MQHLDPLRLAALDHEAATPAELAHLSSCVECRKERDAYEALGQIAFAEARSDIATAAPPLTDWTSLSARLRSEGLLRTTGEHAVNASMANTPLVVRSLHGGDVAVGQSTSEASTREAARLPAARRGHFSHWMRFAAALLLVLGGAIGGRLTAGEGLTSSDARLPQSASLDGSRSSGLLVGNQGFASVEEAIAVLSSAQRDYERASLWLAGNDDNSRSPDVYRARLAALDQMMAASRAALRDAPQDPILNHYYLSAYTAREATLQQLVSSLPVDKTIEGF